MYNINLKLEESERQKILSKHSKYKKVLLEELKRTKGRIVEDENPYQAPPKGQDWLPGFTRAQVIEKCFSSVNGVGVKLRDGSSVIKTESGNIYNIYTNKINPDGRYIKYSYELVNNEYKLTKTSSWSCKALTSTSDELMQKYKDAKYKTAAEWNIPENELKDKTRYEEVTVGNQKLYRYLGDGVQGGFTPAQKKYIEKLKSQNIYLSIDDVLEAGEDPDEYDRTIFDDKYQVFPKGKQITVWVNKGAADANIETTVSSKVSTENIPEEECRKSILTYWAAFKEDTPISQTAFTPMKMRVKRCVRAWENNWSNIGVKKKETRDLLDIIKALKGVGRFDGMSVSRTDKYNILK